MQTLRCQPWGNPAPRLTCLRETDNASLPIGILDPVKKEFKGTYLCLAESARGKVTRKVVLTVLCGPRRCKSAGVQGWVEVAGGGQ